MLSVDEVQRIMSDLESDRIERTSSTKNTDKFAKAVCAFANDLPAHGRPGYLLVGVDDDGTPTGLTVTDDLLKNLGGLRGDGRIQPLPTITVQRVVLDDDNELAVVEVQPAAMPPVRYNGRVHIRVGPRKDVATEQEERQLTERRVSGALTEDAWPCAGATLDDLALDLFTTTYRPAAIAPDVIEENHRPVEVQLASLRFFDLRSQQPTNAGLLLFGRDVRRNLNGAYVQYLRLDGDSLAADVVDDRVFDGDLLTVLRELTAFVNVLSARRPVSVSALREKTISTYPVVALRELLMNAILHRNYGATAPIRFYEFDDRIEVQSPGGLYGEANSENFPNQNSYRNPVVAEAMKVLGFVNKFGRGVIRARQALADNGSPECTFEFCSSYVLVTIGAHA